MNGKFDFRIVTSSAQGLWDFVWKGTIPQMFTTAFRNSTVRRNHFEASIKGWKHLCSRECLDHSIDSIILYSTWTRFGFHGIPKALTTLRGSKKATEICGSYLRKHDTRTMCREATFREVWKIDTFFLFCTIFNFGMESVITLSSY
ncbi:uncharacterized protein LOC114953653 [Acropora millepora]|uniref:uncharacterized protein LOC114953653 n=1 Tax=Acropora millepora TaxID=45264 RepID=UPI0010FC78A3|nr:uncharacterized protein LOC114953653 [Acropora millepora]